MPDQTDPRVVEFLQKRDFHPDYNHSQPAPKVFYSWIKRAKDRHGNDHDIKIVLRYTYGKNKESGIPVSCYVYCVGMHHNHWLTIVGRWKWMIRLDEAVEAIMSVNNILKITKDKTLETYIGRRLLAGDDIATIIQNDINNNIGRPFETCQG